MTETVPASHASHRLCAPLLAPLQPLQPVQALRPLLLRLLLLGRPLVQLLLLLLLQPTLRCREPLALELAHLLLCLLQLRLLLLPLLLLLLLALRCLPLLLQLLLLLLLPPLLCRDPLARAQQPPLLCPRGQLCLLPLLLLLPPPLLLLLPLEVHSACRTRCMGGLSVASKPQGTGAALPVVCYSLLRARSTSPLLTLQ